MHDSDPKPTVPDHREPDDLDEGLVDSEPPAGIDELFRGGLAATAERRESEDDSMEEQIRKYREHPSRVEPRKRVLGHVDKRPVSRVVWMSSNVHQGVGDGYVQPFDCGFRVVEVWEGRPGPQHAPTIVKQPSASVIKQGTSPSATVFGTGEGSPVLRAAVDNIAASTSAALVWYERTLVVEVTAGLDAIGGVRWKFIEDEPGLRKALAMIVGALLPATPTDVVAGEIEAR